MTSLNWLTLLIPNCAWKLHTREYVKYNCYGPYHTTVYIPRCCTRSRMQLGVQASSQVIGAGCKSGIGKPSPSRRRSERNVIGIREGTSAALKGSDKDCHNCLLDIECAQAILLDLQSTNTEIVQYHIQCFLSPFFWHSYLGYR